MYTNTSNPKAIAGFLFLTFATTAIVILTPQILENSGRILRSGKEKLEDVIRNGKKEYVICQQVNGRIFDTGKRIWR